jgi:hypothetical protein
MDPIPTNQQTSSPTNNGRIMLPPSLLRFYRSPELWIRLSCSMRCQLLSTIGNLVLLVCEDLHMVLCTRQSPPHDEKGPKQFNNDSIFDFCSPQATGQRPASCPLGLSLHDLTTDQVRVVPFLPPVQPPVVLFAPFVFLHPLQPKRCHHPGQPWSRILVLLCYYP